MSFMLRHFLLRDRTHPFFLLIHFCMFSAMLHFLKLWIIIYIFLPLFVLYVNKSDLDRLTRKLKKEQKK